MRCNPLRRARLAPNMHPATAAPPRFPRTRGLDHKRGLALPIDEGVVVRNGRVDLARFGWQRDLDAELWAPK